MTTSSKFSVHETFRFVPSTRRLTALKNFQNVRISMQQCPCQACITTSARNFEHLLWSPPVVIPSTLSANLYVSLVIQHIVLPFMNSIQGGVLQQNNTHPRTAAVTQCSLLSVDMLSWPARSPDLSPIEDVRDKIGRQLQHQSQPELNALILNNQVQKVCNSIP
ncbi:uncharacterized protein TNCV_4534651 [Trichonephila clavipes]|nr:uncharacterized protein TNCV_4534651 [Trichonephila clavipes]